MRTSLLGLALIAPAIQAQPDDPPKPKVLAFALTVKPAGEQPGPVRHPLLPSFRDRTAGNAAIYYHRAIGMRRPYVPSMRKFEDEFDKVLEKTPRRLVGPEIEDYLKTYDRVFVELFAAARCRQCDWQLEDRIDTHGNNVLTEEIQECRGLAAALKYRIRWLLSQGKVEDALTDIQTGMAMGRHIGEGPTLIVRLVGIAIDSIFLGELIHVMQMPNSPNFYRALSMLPSPLFRDEATYDGEQRSLEATMKINHIRKLPPTHDEAVRALVKFSDLEKAQRQGRGEGNLSPDQIRDATLFAAYLLPTARKMLPKYGYSEADIKKMTDSQIAVTDFVLRMRERCEELCSVLRLPYSEMLAAWRIYEKRFPDGEKNLDFVEIMHRLLMPAVAKVRFADIRLDRQIAMLRVIEAIRLYAAENQGKLPEKLDAAAERVSLPTDPATGKSFEYRVEKNTFKLIAPPFDGAPPSVSNTVEYTVTVTP